MARRLLDQRVSRREVLRMGAALAGVSILSACAPATPAAPAAPLAKEAAEAPAAPTPVPTVAVKV